MAKKNILRNGKAHENNELILTQRDNEQNYSILRYSMCNKIMRAYREQWPSKKIMTQNNTNYIRI